jgi:hypothetical protein
METVLLVTGAAVAASGPFSQDWETTSEDASEAEPESEGH